MVEKKIESTGIESGSAADADHEKIEAYLTSRAWETRLAEARVRREKVLAAKHAAAQPDRDRPKTRSNSVRIGTAGCKAAPMRPQATEAHRTTVADDGGAAIEWGSEARSRRRTTIVAAGFVAVFALVAATWMPILRPLSDSHFGASDVPDPAVELPDLVGFGAGGEAHASAMVRRPKVRHVAAAPRLDLPLLPKPSEAPPLSRLKDGAGLTEGVPALPQTPAADEIALPSRSVARSGADMESPAPPTGASLGPDETIEMAALALPGLAIADPVFPVRPVERAMPRTGVSSDGHERADAAPKRLSLPDMDGMARSGPAAPQKPAAVEPYMPISPSQGAVEDAMAAFTDTRAGLRDAAPFEELATGGLAGAAELTLDGIVESRGAARVAADLMPSLSRPSMPLRPESGSATPLDLPPIGAPRLSAIRPDFPASDRDEEGPAFSAPDGASVATLLPSKPSPPAAETDVAALGQSTLSNAAQYRLTLHAAEDMAAALHDRLIAIGFTTVEVTVSSFAGPSTSVFFFHDEDASAAAQLALMFGGEAVSAVGIVPSPAVGALDIHVGG